MLIIMNKINKLGESGVAKNGLKMEIIAYRNSNDIDVKFENVKKKNKCLLC